MPGVLRDRLPAWLQPQAVVAECHWLDTLANALEMHKAQYQADVKALAAAACPPLALFDHGHDWLHVGKELRQVYSHVIRQAINTRDDVTPDDISTVLNTSFDDARAASEAFLAQWPANKRHYVLLGAAAYLYAQGPQQGESVRDALIWQLGKRHTGEGNGRMPGLAQAMLDALRQIGLLGEPVWTTMGAVRHYQDEPSAECVGVPVCISGVWFNWLRATRPDTPTTMSLVPKSQRDQAKARIADFVQDKFRGMVLTTEVTETNRIITRTPHGNLFGYVQKDHELAAIRYDQWRIAWATAVDGNLLTVLTPAV